MEHSIVPPSSSNIWGKPGGCTYWPTMNQMFPETEPKLEAQVGEASHEIGFEMISEGARGVSIGWHTFEKRAATNGLPFTKEMYDGARIYERDVREVMRKTKVFDGPNLGIEQRLEMPQIHELSFGKCDCYLYDQKNFILYLWDYKFGFIPYEAFEFWQGINYFAGIFNKLPHLRANLDRVTVHIRIVQPRAFHRDGVIREWVVPAVKLIPSTKILHDNAHKSLSEDATAVSGPHCAYCPGRHTCETALRAGVQLYEAATNPLPMDMSPLALGVQLSIITRAMKHLKHLKDGYDEQVKFKLANNEVVPLWRSEPTYQKAQWSKPIEELEVLGEMLGVNLIKKTPITVKQAVDLGVDTSVIKVYSNPKIQNGVIISENDGTRELRVFDDGKYT